MRAYASHHIPGGNEKYGNRLEEYVYYLQGVDAAVYIHPCVLYRVGKDLYSMLASTNLIRGVVVVDPCRFSKFTIATADIVRIM